MRLSHLLSEARDLLGSKELQQLFIDIELKHKIKPEQAVALVNQVDPRNKYAKWILQRIEDGSFRGQEDVPRYAETIKKLEQTNQSNRSRGISAIDIMKFSTISDLRKALDIAPMAGEKGFIEDPTELDGVKYLGTVEGLDAYAVTDPHSLGKMGIGTEWCTREDYEGGLENAENYFDEQNGNPIYVFRRDGYPVIQASYNFDQFKDVSDEEINKDFVYNVAEQLGILEQTINFILHRLSKEFLSTLDMPEEIQLAAVKKDGGFIKDIKNPSERVQLAAVQQNGWAIRYIRNPSERVQLAAVKKDGDAIRCIQNPSERVKLAAVKRKGSAIRHIKNPSEELQLAAVQQDGWAIRYIRNPSEAVQLAAVQQAGGAISYIKNPSENVQLAAVQQDGSAIAYIENPSERIENPSERVKLAAVQQNGWAIRYIRNPSEELQLAAVKQDGCAIQYIEKPSEELKLAAVQQNGYAIYRIKNPSEELKLAAVQQNGYAIQFIENPSEELQLAAVQQDGDAIEYIKKPSERVQLAAVKQKGSAIRHIKNPSERVKAAARANGWKG